VRGARAQCEIAVRAQRFHTARTIPRDACALCAPDPQEGLMGIVRTEWPPTCARSSDAGGVGPVHGDGHVAEQEREGQLRRVGGRKHRDRHSGSTGFSTTETRPIGLAALKLNDLLAAAGRLLDHLATQHRFAFRRQPRCQKCRQRKGLQGQGQDESESSQHCYKYYRPGGAASQTVESPGLFHRGGLRPQVERVTDRCS